MSQQRQSVPQHPESFFGYGLLYLDQYITEPGQMAVLEGRVFRSRADAEAYRKTLGRAERHYRTVRIDVMELI